VVGDPAQTIYSFAGASARYLSDFPAKYPKTASIELVRNYRSTPQVVDAANRLLSGSTTRRVELRAQRPAGPEVTYTERPDEVAEAQLVAAQIAKQRDSGRPLNQFAVLFRINAQSEAYEEALTDHKIPYVIRGAARFFDRAEVREAVTRLRGAARGAQTEGELVDVVRATLAGMGWTDDAPEARGQTRDRWESWQALVDQAEEYAAAQPAADLNGFVDDLDRRAAEQHAPVAQGVTLATFHAAKGLEWDSVFLVGLQDGTLPITYATTPEAIEEERRLLYVGMTRAREHLALSWAQARNPGQAARRKPSRFLGPLLPEQAMSRTTKSSSRRARMCSVCGKPLTSSAEKTRGRCEGCPAPYDEELFDRLREWRRVRAKTDEVAAFMVFSNRTLEEVAEHRPQTPAALLEINGIGPEKLQKYGEEVLEIVG
jgi:DNA helicase-2/ATP-dependent DNA helicase PcrA